MAPNRSANKWLDRSQPQTLYSGTILLYINAGFWLLQMLVLASVLGFTDALLGVMGVLAIFAGLGIANEKKAGYRLGIVVAGLNLAYLLWLALHGGYSSISLVINLIFAMALMGLLVHPMSRSYQRIWFKSLSGRPGRRRWGRNGLRGIRGGRWGP